MHQLFFIAKFLKSLEKYRFITIWFSSKEKVLRASFLGDWLVSSRNSPGLCTRCSLRRSCASKVDNRCGRDPNFSSSNRRLYSPRSRGLPKFRVSSCRPRFEFPQLHFARSVRGTDEPRWQSCWICFRIQSDIDLCSRSQFLNLRKSSVGNFESLEISVIWNSRMIRKILYVQRLSTSLF